jgi:uncharacterized protein
MKFMSTDTQTQTGQALNEEGKAALARGALKLARKTFLRGAHLGHPGAQLNYGTMCFWGNGGCRDYPEAARWFREAAEQGDAAAQSNLAGMYACGLGVRVDSAKAFQLMLRAANAGDPGAQFNMGTLYAAGDGVAEDHVEAYTWFVISLAQGVVEAGAFVLQFGVLLSPEELAVAHDRIREFRSRNR